MVAVEHLTHCRKELDALPGGGESLIIDAVDGGYSNRTYLGSLPQRCEAVARFRKDAKLRAYLPSEERKGARQIRTAHADSFGDVARPLAPLANG